MLIINKVRKVLYLIIVFSFKTTHFPLCFSGCFWEGKRCRKQPLRLPYKASVKTKLYHHFCKIKIQKNRWSSNHRKNGRNRKAKRVGNKNELYVKQRFFTQSA
jgi:hypothetical protein